MEYKDMWEWQVEKTCKNYSQLIDLLRPYMKQLKIMMNKDKYMQLLDLTEWIKQ